MRTTKRFTPKVLERFERTGRGQGVHENYQPWHQVTRGDPASSGRSHLICHADRLVHLLSDVERDAFHFALQLPDLEDVREQLPLDLETGPHPLRAYTMRGSGGEFPGTLQLADELGIKHPKLSSATESRPWTLSTDLVVARRTRTGALSLQAIAVKPLGWDGKKKERTKQLLRLEREYWKRRGVDWLLITPGQWDQKVTLTFRRIAGWALAPAVAPELLSEVEAFVRSRFVVSALDVTKHLEQVCGDDQTAARALWQAVWSARLPINLRRGWRPQEPLEILSQEEFWQQNPVASGRTAWI